jgi:hypothetical protein
MPTSLRTLVSTKGSADLPSEFHLERGRIWSYVPSMNQTPVCFCWCPPSAGIAVIEVWGAGGSGARMCCCGWSIPGNAGAYSRKTICFSQRQSCCTFVCGVADHACRESNLCFKGCSRPGVACWRVGDSSHLCCIPGIGSSAPLAGVPCDGCICSQGARGGISMCTTGESGWCCYMCHWFCGTKLANENCGLICNIIKDNCTCICGCMSRMQYDCCFANCWGATCCVAQVCTQNAGPQWNWARAYGGDINCCGHFSCSAFLQCNTQDNCCFVQYLATPAGHVARDGSVLAVSLEQNNEFTNGDGAGGHQHNAMISAGSRNPSQHIPWSYCWGFGGGCGCYEDSGCYGYVPPGHPGVGATVCGNVRDTARKGGPAAIRIKFITG